MSKIRIYLYLIFFLIHKNVIDAMCMCELIFSLHILYSIFYNSICLWCVGYGKDNPTLVTKIQLKVYKGYIKSSTLINECYF